MPEVLMVIAPVTFRDEEYAEPKAVLESRGAHVTTASTRPGECRGKLGMVAHADIAVDDTDGADYDAVVFVGGGGSEVFFDDPGAHDLAREAFEAGKVVAAICIAPSILAHAGLLDGRQATAFETQQDDLIEHGALWTDRTVAVDLPFITANGPAAAREFGDAIAEAVGI